MKKALVCLMDDKFYGAFRVFLASFLHHNSWFRDDICIIDVGLSEPIRSKIRGLYPKIDFHTPIYDNYSHVKTSTTAERLKKTYYTLDAFILPYQRIIFIDLDTVIMGSMLEVFECAQSFAGVQAYNRSTDQLQLAINSGLFVLNHSVIKPNIYDRLLQIAAPGHNLPDQAVLNTFFKGRTHFLPKKYNVEKRMYKSLRMAHILKDVRMWHYVGEKPWQAHKPGSLESLYVEVETYWHFWNWRIKNENINTQRAAC